MLRWSFIHQLRRNISCSIAAFLAFASTALFSNSAEAKLFETKIFVGNSQFKGDLSHEQRNVTRGFGFRYFRSEVLTPRTLGEYSFGLGFDVVFLSTVHNREFFPYPTNEPLNLVNFLLFPTMCFETGTSASVCGGIGLGTVNVNSSANRQDYGSWHYELSTKVEISRQFSIELFTKYVGKVEQRLNSTNSEFWFFNYGIALNLATFSAPPNNPVTQL